MLKAAKILIAIGFILAFVSFLIEKNIGVSEFSEAFFIFSAGVCLLGILIGYFFAYDAYKNEKNNVD